MKQLILQDRKGYFLLYAPHCPIAAPSGYVSAQRVVFYDAAGPGPHACAWCGIALRFESAPCYTRRHLFVDHLDGDPTNNAAANLVASCLVCNMHRAKFPERFTLGGAS